MAPRYDATVTPPDAPDAPAAPAAPAAPRAVLLAHALRLEYATVGWNVVEAVVALSAAEAAGSVALLGFGADSVIESLSGAVLVWRLRAERVGDDAERIERLDRRAHRLVGVSLFALAAYVGVAAAHALWTQRAPEASPLGIAVTAVSAAAMLVLARAKRRAAAALASRALEADSFQTTACWWLSVITLTGIAANAALGWWWADPAAALAMTALLAREGADAWRRRPCCGC